MENQEKLMQFVTWLGENVPELKGKAPEQIVETVNKLSESEQGQQMLQGLIKEFESSMTGMFKKGGKIDYLLCLKSGGSIQDCGCGKKIEKSQNGNVIPTTTSGELFKGHPTYSQDGWTTYDDHPVGYFIGGYTNPLYRNANWKSGENTTDRYQVANYYAAFKADMPQFAIKYEGPKFGKRGTYLAQKPWPYHSSDYSEADYINDKKQYKKLKNLSTLETVARGIASQNEAQLLPPIKQTGGVISEEPDSHISRRDAVKAAMSMGLNRAQSVNAYNSLLSKVLDQGISGRKARQAARANMIDAAGKYAGRQLAEAQPVPPSVELPVLDDNIVIEDEPINIENTPVNLGEDKGLNIGSMDTFYGSFKDAFASARRSGLDSFVWNNPNAKYARYSTKLGKGNNSESGWRRAKAEANAANQRVIDSAENSAKNAKTGFGKLVKSINAGMLRSQLDSPTLGLQKGGIVIPEKEFLPITPEQYPHASRKDAIDAARQLGFEGSDARRAYGHSKKMARQFGFKGNNLRQVARYNLIDMAYPRAGMTEEESMNNLLNNFTTKISYN